MDKRWIGIIIILLVGIGCMYFIIESSTTVGNAISVVNKSIVTMPHGFSKAESDKNSLELINKNNEHEYIFIKDLGKSDTALKNFKYKINSLANDNAKVISNNTNVTNNITTYTAYYINYDKPDYNNSVTYFYSYNHTFYLKLVGFDNVDSLNENINFIASTIQPDYKQSQD